MVWGRIELLSMDRVENRDFKQEVVLGGSSCLEFSIVVGLLRPAYLKNNFQQLQ